MAAPLLDDLGWRRATGAGIKAMATWGPARGILGSGMRARESCIFGCLADSLNGVEWYMYAFRLVLLFDVRSRRCGNESLLAMSSMWHTHDHTYDLVLTMSIDMEHPWNCYGGVGYRVWQC